MPSTVWNKNWVVHCQPAGSGQMVLDYLGRYVFRVAISNSRLEQIDHGHGTFRYRDNRSHQMRRVALPGEEFIRRFLEHVSPRGCAKVRYYGLWSGSCRKRLDQARVLLNAPRSEAVDDFLSDASVPELPAPPSACPYCKIGLLVQIEVICPRGGVLHDDCALPRSCLPFRLRVNETRWSQVCLDHLFHGAWKAPAHFGEPRH